MVDENKKTRKTEKFIIVFTIIFAILLIIALFVIRASVAFPLGYFLLSLGGVVVVGGGIVLGYHFIINKKKPIIEEQKKMPPAITVEEFISLAKRTTQNETYCDYIDDGAQLISHQLGRNIKSLVSAYIAPGTYEDCKYVIIMNRHFPNQTCSILIFPNRDCDVLKNSEIKNEIFKTMMQSASYPEEDPSIRESITQNPALGITTITKEVVRDNKEEKEKKEKEAEL
jgi:hypothetical protein